MHYVFYDTETTGLTRIDEVIQVGGIITDEQLYIIDRFMFYCYTQVPISKGAKAQHGITASELIHLSDGKTFEDYWYNLPIVRNKNVTWVSYSTNGFDERMINQTLTHNGLPSFDFGKKVNYLDNRRNGIYNFDAMLALKSRCCHGHNKKLSQLVSSLPLSIGEIDKRFIRVAGNLPCKYHDALYDAFSLWLVVFCCRKRLGLSELC